VLENTGTPSKRGSGCLLAGSSAARIP